MSYLASEVGMCPWNVSGVGSWLELRGGGSGYCIQVVGAVKRLEELNWPAFGAHEEEGSALVSSLTASELYELIILGIECNVAHKLKKSYNPYLISFTELLMDINKRLDARGFIAYEKTDLLNYSVGFLREKFFSKEIRLLKYKQKKAYRSRVKSAYKYIHSLRNKYSRILCVRVDLSYRKGMFLESNSFGDHVKNVKADWRKMRSIITESEQGRDMVGYVLKLEYGLLKGFHYHALIIYDGSKRQQDILLGKMLGDCWINDVMDNNDGRYFNCNRYKKKYKKLGIGEINYYDDDKYRNLMDLVVTYMLKPDDVLDFIGPKERFLFKGVTKSTAIPNKGRPRKKSIC